ncbi:MAG TPA: YbhB/YbcL family Raf kinase inhibitor-like protein [Reyranella sp.]|nr:YbhB/YbcL family Raf kinase inhibitor-like protein [Reyranella sp.]
MALVLTSNSFKEGATLANDHVLSASFGFGTDGGNKSPHLAWSGAPAGTKSFAVSCLDPDAPTGSGFWHWMVVNIPATTTELKLDAGNLKAGLLPKGAVSARTDLGQTGYIGPAPPPGHGPHRYIFTVFAVKEEALPVNADASSAVCGFYLHFNTLEKATLTGMYQR